ncbi:TetR/AcrR family transcriptional regulator [Actinomadura parmotrematis]|uniref:TetR/AcrR family transcriptional regulator n=1 Tax=Actinomadura parmotrematis TaxID=2864039 RepID=UPI0027E2E66D|nr:helix-turn-helix domain-containing protein [Actinomadura parmotrematis]
MTAQVRRRPRSDARDNRERILAVARAAFAAEGPDVPVREIARRAEVGPATVYRHFPTKEALLTEALAGRTDFCSTIVEEGLADPDAWQGFRRAIERLLEVRALDRDAARAAVARLPPEAAPAADRERSLRLMLELLRRAKDAGGLRADLVLEDVVLALMANGGIRAETPEIRAAASRRFAALILQSFRADPAPAPLPPPVRLPLGPA